MAQVAIDHNQEIEIQAKRKLRFEHFNKVAAKRNVQVLENGDHSSGFSIKFAHILNETCGR